LDHWREICSRLGIAFPFKNRDEICHTGPAFDEAGGSWDWLVVNSECLSGQLPVWDEGRLARLALSLPGRVITTHTVTGLPCTLGLAPRLQDIARLAGRCRFVVGINTGPMIACLTRKMLDRVERLVVVDLLHGFEYRAGKACWCRNLDEFEAAVSTLAQRAFGPGISRARSPISRGHTASQAGSPPPPC
jgi:hypothetical protein